MTNIKKILACIDFSEFSLMTLEYAVKLAKCEKAEIIAYHVINERDFKYVAMANTYLPDPISLEDCSRKLEKERKTMLKQFITMNFYEDKHLMILRIERGVPFESILNTIESQDIDLVVMANKGRGNVSGMLFGSAAEKVFRHSPVPVLSVRKKDKGKGKKKKSGLGSDKNIPAEC